MLNITSFRQSGFTLVELLVALMVFSLLMTIAYQSVNLLSGSQMQLEAEQAEMSALQKALLIWEKDIRQYIHSLSVVDSDEADQEVELLKLQTLSSGGNGNVKLANVIYSYKDQQLHRQVVERKEDEKVSATILARNLRSAEVKLSGAENSGSVASGVVLSLEHESLGVVRRVVYLPERHWKDAPNDPLIDENQTGSGGGDGTGPAAVITPPDPNDPDAGEAIW